MKLICDDIAQTYFWVDDEDEKSVISPHFDYEEDADKWYRDMKNHFYEKWNEKWMKTTE